MKMTDVLSVLLLVVFIAYLIAMNPPNDDRKIIYIDEFTTVYENE